MARTIRITKDGLKKQIAKNLRNARMAHDPDLSQEKVGQLFDPPLTRSAIQQWEVGQALPDVDRLAILSKRYGCTIDALIFGDDEAEQLEVTPEALQIARTWLQLEKKDREAFKAILLSLRGKAP